MRTNDSEGSPRWTVRSAADLSRAVAGVRTERRLTQEGLAERAGVDRSYIARLESGRGGTLAIERVLRMLRRMGATVTVSLDDGDDDAAG
jgi:transcriptional regulator with XRE-family HTH domain